MDPNRDSYKLGMAAGLGLVQTFIPTGAIGIFAGAFIAILASLLIGLFDGVWVFVAIVTLVVLVLLTSVAVKRELAKEDALPPSRPHVSLPPDADLSDEERRQAMRRFAEGKDDT
jgi:hypothetical protein